MKAISGLQQSVVPECFLRNQAETLKLDPDKKFEKVTNLGMKYRADPRGHAAPRHISGARPCMLPRRFGDFRRASCLEVSSRRANLPAHEGRDEEIMQLIGFTIYVITIDL